jgi:branched-chain amino acid transport system substrate-binding protein
VVASGRASAGAPTGPGPNGASAAGVGGAAPARACPPPCAPLVVGSVGTWSGIVGQNVVGGLNALRAWVAAVNAAGGLGGHTVRLEVADDGTDPARHRALVQELVERRGVVAFSYNAAVFSGQASVDYLNQHRIPVVGGSGTEPWYTTSPMFFTQIIAGEVAIEATTASYARSARAMGLSRMGLITCSDGVQVCEDTAKSVPRYAQKYGVQLTYQGKASLAAPDFTANCLAARNAGVEILYLALDANSYQRLGRSCASVGYHPKYGIAQPVMLADLAKDPNLQGSPGVSYTAPFFYDASPAIAEFHRAMAQYAPDAALTGSASLGWSAAKLLAAAARQLSATPTSGDILDGLWSLAGDDLGGLTAPLRFRRDEPTVPAVCYWQVIVGDGRYQSPDSGQRHCEGG